MKDSSKKKQDKKQGSDLVTRESFGSVGCIFSALLLLILFTGEHIFGDIGTVTRSFLLGLFGYSSFLLLPVALILSVFAFLDKHSLDKKRKWTHLVLCVYFVFVVVQAASTYTWEREGYIARCFSAGESFSSATAAGFLGGLFVYLCKITLGDIGAIVALSVPAILFALLAIWKIRSIFGDRAGQAEPEQTTQNTQQQSVAVQTETAQKSQQSELFREPVVGAWEEEKKTERGYEMQDRTKPVESHESPVEVLQRPGVHLKGNSPRAYSPFGISEKHETVKDELDGKSGREFLLGGYSPKESYENNLFFKKDSKVNQREIRTELSQNKKASDETNPNTNGFGSYSSMYAQSVNEQRESVRRTMDTPVRRDEPKEPVAPVEFVRNETPSRSEEYLSVDDGYTSNRQQERSFERERNDELYTLREQSFENAPISGETEEKSVEREETPVANRDRGEDTFARGREETDELFIRSDREEPVGRDIFDEPKDNEPRNYRLDDARFERGRDTEELPPERDFDLDEEFSRDRESVRDFEQTLQEKPVSKPQKEVRIRPYEYVPMDLFDCTETQPELNEEEIEYNKAMILDTLDCFGVKNCTVSSVTCGPTVMRYNVVIPRNVLPQRVVGLSESIAMALQTKGINIYPNYEDGAVSIETANKKRQTVHLGRLLNDEEFIGAKPTSLTFAIGKDVGNKNLYGDICKMTHLLVAGQSGQGKSVFLRGLIISLITKYAPEDLRLILVDAKGTEFAIYKDLPHLVVNEIVSEPNKTIQCLNWAIEEMERRFQLFNQKTANGEYVVDINDYNQHLSPTEQKLAKIVIIVDELGDFMLVAKKDLEERIARLTQKSRAAGIHLILATQRPSTDIITGIIKANLKTRFAFTVSSDVDSRVILDKSGANNLLGAGDMLYTMDGMRTPVRAQSAFISPEETQTVIGYIKSHNDCVYDKTVETFINKSQDSDPSMRWADDDAEVDKIYIEALRYVIQVDSASISMLTRRFSVGYNKAGKIIEWMGSMGYISPFDGSRSRKVLITAEEFEQKYGNS